MVARGERIAVVGAGIVGCAVALELSRRGARVTVYDRRGIGGGATQASAGILAPYTEAHGAGALFDFSVRGLLVYDDFVARVRALVRTEFEYLRSGTVEVAEDASRRPALYARLSENWASDAGLQWLEPDALSVIVPSIARTTAGGLLCRSHAHVAAEPFSAAIAEAASRASADFRLRLGVERIELLSDEVVVHTEEGPSGFDRVVLCAGAWSPEVDPLGATRERIRPVRGQLVRLFSAEVTLPTILWGKNCYIVPWKNGTVLVGATSEDVGFDERTTASGVRQLLCAAEELVPSLGSSAFVEARVGLRPAAVDGFPIIGPRKDPRVIYATGHFRNGVLLAPLTATLVADYVFEDRLDPAFSAA